MGLSGLLSRIAGFLGKLSGVRWFIIVDRDARSVATHSPVISDKDAEELKELIINAGEISEAFSKYSLFRRREMKTRTLYVKFNGEGLEVENIGKFVVAINTDEKLLPVFSKIFDLLRRGETVKCENCGRELLLETYTCPRCGRTVPFIVEECPHCGYNLRVKKCPGCGNYIDVRGRVIKRDVGVLATGVLIGILVLLLGIYMGLTVTGNYRLLFYGIGAIMGAIMGLLGYILSSPR